MVVSTGVRESNTRAGSLAQVERGGALTSARANAWIPPAGDELFRAIYTRADTGGSEVLAVTSAIAGEGKSTVSVGLAVTIAQDFPERRVLLVETDLQHPTLARDFEIDPNPGLVDLLLADEPVEPAYRPTLLANLQVLPSGGPLAGSGRLLRSRAMTEVVAAMRATHDLVILDLTSILADSDALTVADLADGVIVVVRAGVTPISLVNKAIKLLDDGKLLGAVLNGTRSSIPGWLRRLGRL